jgi:hypothetical protein
MRDHNNKDPPWFRGSEGYVTLPDISIKHPPLEWPTEWRKAVILHRSVGRTEVTSLSTLTYYSRENGDMGSLVLDANTFDCRILGLSTKLLFGGEDANAKEPLHVHKWVTNLQPACCLDKKLNLFWRLIGNPEKENQETESKNQDDERERGLVNTCIGHATCPPPP